MLKPWHLYQLLRRLIDPAHSKMPSKGISVYSYISVADIAIEFTAPKGHIVKTPADNFSFEVDSKNIPGATVFTGQFKWRVLRSGVEVASAYSNINSLSGRMEGGTMTKTEATLSIIKDDLIISYGFYDAGAGLVGLPNREQCWVGRSHPIYLTSRCMPVPSFGYISSKPSGESNELMSRLPSLLTTRIGWGVLHLLAPTKPRSPSRALCSLLRTTVE
jgi:hypothetical protein